MPELNVDDLTLREQIVFVASCQLEQAGSDDPRESVIYDPEFADEFEHLVELRLARADRYRARRRARTRGLPAQPRSGDGARSPIGY